MNCENNRTSLWSLFRIKMEADFVDLVDYVQKNLNVIITVGIATSSQHNYGDCKWINMPKENKTLIEYILTG